MYHNRTSLLLTTLIMGVLLFSCNREKSFETNVPKGPASGGTAAFTLSASAGTCSNATLQGTYTKGKAATTSETITIDVDVTTAGTWTMNSSVSNGLYFMGTGVFTATGVQTITLTGTGTPTAEGDQTFSIKAGTSTCTFLVTVNAAPAGGGGGGGGTPGGTGDHLPLTAGTWWSYEDPSDPGGDTLIRRNVGALTINGNVYRKLLDSVDGDEFDTTYYRKAGSDYLEWTETDAYTALTFDQPKYADILFMKEGLTTGATWTSTEFTGLFSGQAAKVKYVFTCENANATVNVNGISFNNTYIIKFKPQVSLLGAPYQDDGLQWKLYYVQGIGPVYVGLTQAGSIVGEQNIRHWKVN